METEIKLIIVDPDPEKIRNNVAALTHLGDYPLRAERDLKIRDYYFDTEDRFLQRKSLALRLRISNGQQYLTLKGKGQIQQSGALQRMEIEDHWSENSLRKVVDILNKERLNIHSSQIRFEAANPVITLQGLNLYTIQDRTSHRKVRSMLDAKLGETQAELVIDTVLFQPEKNIIVHYELEIEEKSTKAGKIIENCVENLLSDYPKAFKPWTINKLELGMILEELISIPEFQKCIDSKNQITKKGYSMIKNFRENETERT